MIIKTNKLFVGFSIFLFYFMLIPYTIQSECSEGCLKCTLNQEGLPLCSICDIFTGFVMSSEGDCIKHKDPNCLIFSYNQEDSICSQCSKGYVVDYETKNCVQIPSEKLISGCHSYTLIGRCSLCSRDSYLKENSCVPVKIKKPNCFKYFDDSLCSICDEGFKLDGSSGSCIQINSENENCLIKASSKCNQCDAGYISTSNPLLFLSDQQDLLHTFVNELFWGQKHSHYPISSCIKSPDPHCVHYNDTTPENSIIPICKTCKKGYFFDEISFMCMENPVQGILHCLNYIDFQTCTECSPEYYLQCNECKPRSNYLNCSIPNSRMDSCYICADGYFLNESNECEKRSPLMIENCQKYHRLENICEQCDNEYILTNTFTMCFKEISNCKRYKSPIINEDLKMICEECDSDYYLDESTGICNRQYIPYCKKYKENHNLCTECNDLFTLVKNECQYNSFIDNCQFKGSLPNQCRICQNLFYLNDSFQCVPINDPDCLENETNKNECTKCKANRYLRKNTQTKDIKCSISNSALSVPYCESSDSSDKDKICTECQSGYSLSNELFYYSENPKGCSVVKFSGKCQFCGQLDEDYEVDTFIHDPSSVFPPKKTSNLNSICAQAVEYGFLPLDQAAYGQCLKCRDPTKYFLHQRSCLKRSKIHLDQCSEYNHELDECNICKSGTYAVPREIEEEIKCLPNPENFVPLQGCLVHDLSDPSLCVICDTNYYLSTERVCSPSDTYERNFDVKNELRYTYDSINPYISYKVQLNYLYDHRYCERFMKTDISSTYLLCSKCLPNSYTVKDDEIITFMNNNDTYGYIYDTSVFCMNPTQFKIASQMKNNEIIPYVSIDECLDATHDNNSIISERIVGCQNCKNGLIPHFVKAQYENKNNTNIHSLNFYTVESCIPNENSKFALKKYYGFGFMKNVVNVSTGYVQSGLKNISFDSCQNANQSLIYLTEVHNFNKFKREDPSMPDRVKFYDCIALDDTTKKTGCHVYYNSPSKWNNILDGLKCLSCQPGYSSSSSSAAYPFKDLTCTLIENCNMTDPSKNTMMNGCNNCKTGYANKINISNQTQFIDFTTCSLITIPNCKHEIHNDNKCGVCAKGYILNDDGSACELAPLPENCDALGMAKGMFNLDILRSSSNYRFKVILSGIVFDHKDEYRTGACKTCSEGHSHFVDIYAPFLLENDKFKCVPHENDTIPNCELYSGNKEKKCGKCEDGYILTNDGVCIDNPNNSFKDCLVVAMNSSTNQYDCEKCLPGHYPEPRDKQRCFKTMNFCKEYFEYEDDEVCKVCEEGYTRIEPSRSNNMMCAKIPAVNLYLEKFNIYISEELNFSRIYLDIPYSGYNSLNPPKVIQRQTCFPDHVLPYCLNQNYKTGECNECEPGYYPREPYMQCFPISISGCKIQDNIYECRECQDDYFMTELSQCNKRYALYCDETKDDLDECDSCMSGYYLTNNKCFAYTVENCDEFDKSNDICNTCKDGYFTENDKCVPHTVIGCKSFSPTSNKCLTCFDQHYLLNGLCHIHTVKHCASYNKSDNKCDSCIQNGSTSTNAGVYNLLITDGLCHQSEPIKHCKTYFSSSGLIGKCQMCEEGYLEMNNNSECVKKPTGIPHCQQYSSINVCSLCDPSYYIDLSMNKCMPVYRPIENCWNHKSLTECDKCIEGLIPSSDFTSCIPIIEQSCTEWTDPLTCSECPPNKILNPVLSVDNTQVLKTECKEYIPNCKIIINSPFVEEKIDSDGNAVDDDSQDNQVQAQYHCQICANGYYTEGNRTECKKSHPIVNCASYAHDGVCHVCDKGYVLSLDKKDCLLENNLVGANCADGILLEEPQCRVCQPGMMVNKEGACVECGGEGCLHCNPANTTQCLLCRGGFHMTSSLICVENSDHKFIFAKEELILAEIQNDQQFNDNSQPI